MSNTIINIRISYKIKRIPLIGSPCVFGINNITILIPLEQDYSEHELNYICLHEILHVYKKDNFLIYIIELLSCLYWWNPLVYVYKNQLNTILELRIDNEVLRILNTAQSVEYAECLVKVKKNLTKNSRNNIPNDKMPLVNFITIKEGILEQRVLRILSFKFIRSSNKLLCFFTFLISFLSILFIFEPYFIDEHSEYDTFKLKKNDRTYLIENDDQTFSLIENGEDKGKIKNVNDFPDYKKIKTYRKKK